MVKKFDHDKKAPTPDIPLIKSDFYNPFGFQGMWRDEHTGLYHTHYRIYNPNHARWLTPDPKGYQDGQNLYRFYGGPNGVDLLGDEIEINGKKVTAKELLKNEKNSGNKLYTEIITRMDADKKYTHKFDSMEVFDFGLSLRANVVKAGVAFSKSGVEFAWVTRDVKLMKFNDELWFRPKEPLTKYEKSTGKRLYPVTLGVKYELKWVKKTFPDGTWEKSQKNVYGSFYDAIDDIYNNGSDYNMECAMACTTILMRGIANEIGRKKFDEIANIPGIGSWSRWEGNKGRNRNISILRELRNKPGKKKSKVKMRPIIRDYIPGDAVFSKHWGENFIYFGDNKYYGLHPNKDFNKVKGGMSGFNKLYIGMRFIDVNELFKTIKKVK